MHRAAYKSYMELKTSLLVQNRTDCGSGNITAEERSAIDVRLTHILTAYAYCDPAVGYCQGQSQCLYLGHAILPQWSMCVWWVT